MSAIGAAQASQLAQVQQMQQVQVAVASKALDTMRDQGEAAMQLMQQAMDAAPPAVQEPGKGEQLDLFG